MTNQEMAQVAHELQKKLVEKTAGPSEALQVLHSVTLMILCQCRLGMPDDAYQALKSCWRQMVISTDADAIITQVEQQLAGGNEAALFDAAGLVQKS